MIAVGDLLDGKYKVTRRLGGGFGEVFQAADTALAGRSVAIKVLTNPDATDFDDLIHEMQQLVQLNHPGVVTFYHHFTHGGRLFLVMEFCGGGTLADRLSGGAVCAERDVFAWGLALCGILAAVHAKGIVHHDIKPSNILFTADGQVKVGDFGVANRLGGTALYLPPEMLLGELRTPEDPRVDVYALGLTLLEALTGRHPFEEMDRAAALQARMAHDFVAGHLPRWAREVLLKATHPAAELRFQTMTEFAEAIEARRVVYVFDRNRLKATELAEKARQAIRRKRWVSAEKMAGKALKLAPDCVPALLVAGECRLLRRRIEAARVYYMQALAISPRTQVQKELGLLSLESGRIPEAIAFLTDHLHRNAADFEACNLLLRCYIEAGRYDAAIALAEPLAAGDKDSCFDNNLLVARCLEDWRAQKVLHSAFLGETRNPFKAYNLGVLLERQPSWSPAGPPLLRSKLLFEDWRFSGLGTSGRANRLIVEIAGIRRRCSGAIVAIGALPPPVNDVDVPAPGVSRRHCLIVNCADDVWLHDLGSTAGTFVDGHRISGRVFLDGVHEMKLGSARIRVAASETLLV